ncbi:16165_t:CDS:2 [Dentiscutata erythropus]|uniref:16165_t:CDS:1 n=1 Tax=Dentiscutata erythropus TaxID=1348616 RepID=A0A9N9G8T1_9GLOM|nr:16165_t:CDS:2 [Dentiscutata erythropus]
MDLDWCLTCSQHTSGTLYCSEACRNQDIKYSAKALLSSQYPYSLYSKPYSSYSIPLSSPSYSPSSSIDTDDDLQHRAYADDILGDSIPIHAMHVIHPFCIYSSQFGIVNKLRDKL